MPAMLIGAPRRRNRRALLRRLDIERDSGGVRGIDYSDIDSRRRRQRQIRSAPPVLAMTAAPHPQAEVSARAHRIAARIGMMRSGGISRRRGAISGVLASWKSLAFSSGGDYCVVVLQTRVSMASIFNRIAQAGR